MQRQTLQKQRFLYFQTPNPEHVSEACFSLTPKVSVLSQEVFLEIGCTEKAWGGEGKVLFNAHRLIEAFEVKPSVVVTDRPEWARAFACGKEMVIPPGKSQETLLTLPIERLPLCGDPTHSEDEVKERTHLMQFMLRVGMRTISDFAKLSLLAINRRFGKSGVLLHDTVMGKRQIVLPLFSPPEKIIEQTDTEEVTSTDVLLRSLEAPLLRISARLHGRKLSAKSFLLIFSLESRKSFSKKLTMTEPRQDAASFQRLLKEYLSSAVWDSPLQNLTIEVCETEPYLMGQLSLFSDEETKLNELSEYVERLRARLGEANVGFPEITESYLPENSWKNRWPPEKEEPSYPCRGRPLYLLDPPHRWRPSSSWELQLSETVAAEWWNGAHIRKYFTAESRQGEKLWVFYDLNEKEWFLHGTFD